MGRAVAADEEVSRYVRELETRADEGDEELGDIPTGEALAEQFERFLAEQGEDEDD